jgi:hypothetical protein
MKITDIVSQKQQKQQVDEAPVGMLKRAGLGIASKLGRQSAKGALNTAAMANGLRKQFDYYLGQTDQKPNSDAIIAFLSTNGFPTAGAEAAIKQAAMAAGTMPAKDMRDTLVLVKTQAVQWQHLILKIQLWILSSQQTKQLISKPNLKYQKLTAMKKIGTTTKSQHTKDKERKDLLSPLMS